MAPTPRSKWPVATLGVGIGLVLGASALLSTALAVHDDANTPFELDANATDNTGNTRDDWQNVFGLGNTPGIPAVGSGEAFIKDYPGPETQYDQGKDSLDISAWTTKSVTAVSPEKNDIENAFAKQYMVDLDAGGPQTTHRVIYFGADRKANDGDAALGFWFFQKRVTPVGDGFGTQTHTARSGSTRGDILVQVDFVNGGASSEIQIFEWLGNNAPPAGTPANKLFGGGTLLEIGFGTSNGSTVCLADDSACATANLANTPFYWAYAAKKPVKQGNTILNQYPSQSFFEGGIDITALLGDVCFNTFLANTRTSHSETADLKDLAFGDFNTCGSATMTKVCYADEELGTPSYDDSTITFVTSHKVVIENDGQGGDIFDVQLRDDSVSATQSCDIVGVTKNGVAQSGSYPIAMPTGTDGWVDIPGGGTLAQAINHTPQLIVTLQCVSTQNPMKNAASIRAAQNDGGPRTILADDGEADADVADCQADVNPALEVTKTCTKDVVWQIVNGVAQPKVCVNVKVKNTGNTSLNVTEWEDDPNNGATADLLDAIDTIGTDHRLAPLAEVTTEHCYTATQPDSGTGATDPNLSVYGDTASATAYSVTDPAHNTEITDTGSTTCPLCPVPPPPGTP
jgi:hypothetical protein